MKKIGAILIMMLFSLAMLADPVLADRGRGDSHGRSHRSYSHSGPSRSHHSSHYKHHGSGGHINGWEAAAIGLGAAVVGSAIVNSYPRERVVVERNTYYHSAPPPCRDYAYDCPRPCDPPPRVWVPGRYEYAGGGYYRRVPGHWE